MPPCRVVTTAMTGLLCGLVPAFQSTRPDLHVALRDGGTAVGAVKGQRLRSLLVAGQLALALVLLAGAGLMIKTTIRTFQFNAGYDASRVLVGHVSLAGGGTTIPGRSRHSRPASLSVWSGFPASVLPSIARCSFADSALLRSA